MSTDAPDTDARTAGRQALHIILAIFFILGMIIASASVVLFLTRQNMPSPIANSSMSQFLKESQEKVLKVENKNGAWPATLPPVINHDGSSLTRIDLRDPGERPLLYRVPTESSHPSHLLIHTDPVGPRPILSITIEGR